MAERLQRVTSLREPPEVGQRYLVPTVKYPWLLKSKDENWPVFLPRHEDAEHLNFKWWHYHVDPRFLSRSTIEWVATWRDTWGAALENALSIAQSTPLQRLADPGGPCDAHGSVPHPPVVWRPRRCYRADIRYMHGGQPNIRAMRNTFAGAQCKRARTGWICPHKGFPLGSVPADEEGVITCPLHGLQVQAASGIVLNTEGDARRFDTARGRFLRPGEGAAERLAALPRDPDTGRPVI